MSLSSRKKALYAFGQFGLSLCAFGVGKLFTAFYISPEAGRVSPFPAFLYQGYVSGFFTVAGLILALGRIVDAASVLWAASASDRGRFRRGRRTGAMSLAALPLALLSVLVFVPPTGNAYALNSVWVIATVVLFYVSLAFYEMPYVALIAELGKSQRQRLAYSASLAACSALAAILGNRVYVLMDVLIREWGMSNVAAFRAVLAFFALAGLSGMVIPLILVRERETCPASPVEDTLPASFGAVISDRSYRPVLLADAMHWLAVSILVAGTTPYMTRLLRISAERVPSLMTVGFLCSIALSVPIYAAARRFGMRRVLLAAFVALAAVLFLSVYAGRYPISKDAQALAITVLVSMPLTAFAVVPNAILADLVVATERKTGVQRGAMYFAVRSLVSKFAQMAVALLFPMVSMIGTRDYLDPGRLGLRFTLVYAIGFLGIGFLFMLGYREKEISAVVCDKVEDGPRG